MANRQHNTTTKTDIVKTCAFWAMTIAAFMYIFSGFIRFLLWVAKNISTKSAGILNQIVSVGQFIGNVALIVAIALPAYGFVRGKTKAWKVVYWVALAVFALGVVLGMLGGLFG